MPERPAPDEPDEPDEPQPDPQPEANDAPQLTIPGNQDELIPLFQDELFGDSGGRSFYRQALTSSYASAAGVDLGQLFYNGAPGSVQLSWDELSAPEQSALKKADGYSDYFTMADLERITGAQMEQAMQTVFGIGLADTQWIGMDRLVFLPEFDCYYFAHTDTNALLPIRVEQVRADAEGYYYVSYRRTESSGEEPLWLCCLRSVDGGWQIVYNLESAGDILPGAKAQCAAGGGELPMLLRPAVSDDLALAVTLALEPSLRDLAPRDAALVATAQDILAVRAEGLVVTVYAAAAFRAYDDGQGEITELSSSAAPVELRFQAYPSSGRVCYALSSLRYRDDPSTAQLFAELTWLGVSGPAMDQLEQPLLEACADDLSRRLAQPLTPRAAEESLDGFYAALSSDDALAAATAVADAYGEQYGVARYQRVGAAENVRATAELRESYADRDAFFSGWTAEEARQRLLAIDISYAMVYHDWAGAPESGVYQQTYLLCRDPDSHLWRVWDTLEAAQLITYQPG